MRGNYYKKLIVAAASFSDEQTGIAMRGWRIQGEDQAMHNLSGTCAAKAHRTRFKKNVKYAVQQHWEHVSI